MIDAMIGIFLKISLKMVWAIHDYDHFSQQQHIWTNIYLNGREFGQLITVMPSTLMEGKKLF